MSGDALQVEDLVDRLAALAAAVAPRRAVLGIAGPPGAGKTTLVVRVLAALGEHPTLGGRVAHVPMDGYHLTNRELDALGRRDRKGAPDTFDTSSYAGVLAAVRTVPRSVVTAPSFDHVEGEPVPGSLAVPVGADLVVTEGNYLLLEEDPWSSVRPLLDEVWWCGLDAGARVDRLVTRHVGAGRDSDDATSWVLRSDEANARVVEGGDERADVVLVDGVVVRASATS